MSTSNLSRGIGGTLFSKTQRAVLALLFGQPERSFYAKEIISLAGVGSGSVQRELKKLETSGLVTVKRIGNQKHYQANRDAPVFEELRGIVVKTFGLADVVRDALSSHADKIQFAFIYGSIARQAETTRSDVDVLICSDELTYREVYERLQVAEQQIGRRIAPNLYKLAEYRKKLKSDNAFVKRVLQQPRITLFGTENGIRQS